MLSAEEIIMALGLEPHPEGGHFKEVFRDESGGGRAHSTAIYYLLRRGERSHWHKVDAAEVWHWYAGAPLRLAIARDESRPPIDYLLGNDFVHGERPMHVVPAQAWQAAESCGEWTLVGCTVAPGFEFSGFELAPEGWKPGAG
ncbi:cupin domain-containing protein [Tepidicaulis sp. LMO-SS28]|uniref:cupin domain-containing protein n=1 Tax=Tepidicaulis sp. LMO-SS28 TaxID=3447455 RepID=UPI003EE2B6C1